MSGLEFIIKISKLICLKSLKFILILRVNLSDFFVNLYLLAIFWV